jgi:hypothetical protein
MTLWKYQEILEYSISIQNVLLPFCKLNKLNKQFK